MVSAFGLIAGVLVLLSILMAGGNVLGQFFKYLLAGLFVFGFILPRIGIFVLVAMCGYFDFLKRVLVIADRVSRDDLMYVLGCPPVLLGGILIGLTSQFLQGKILLNGWNRFCLLIIPVIGMVVFAMNRGGSMNDAVMATINGAFYCVLLIVVPIVLKDGEELRKLLRFTVWAYLPVALYGVWQQVFGLFDFEIAYLKTGLSILIAQLVMNEIRPFSTLNSPTALGAICAALAAMAFLTKWHTPVERGRKPGTYFMWVLGICYVVGLLATTSRSDAITLMVGIVAAPAFMRPQRTLLLYAGSTVAFIALVLASNWILTNIEMLQYKLWAITGVGGKFSEQLTRLGTYSDRLMGFSALTHDLRVWTLFGTSSAVRESVYYHDPLTEMLLKMGAVPLGFTLAICAAILKKLHQQIWRIPDLYDRRLACLCVAIALGFVASSVLSGGRLSIFPVGLHFWLLLSIAGSLAWATPAEEPVAEEGESVAQEPLPAQPLFAAPAPARSAGRFRPVPRQPSTGESV